MRITGGQLRGRLLEVPKGRDVRPATDKVRQAVFNSLYSIMDLEGVDVLDGFCGTGSYGLEALSRGAAHSTFIDRDRKSLQICQQNIRQFKLETVSDVLTADMVSLSVKPLQKKAADLIFLDPPYRQDLLLPALLRLSQTGWWEPEGWGVLECEKDLNVPFGKSKIYGDVQIIFCMHKDVLSVI